MMLKPKKTSALTRWIFKMFAKRSHSPGHCQAAGHVSFRLVKAQQRMLKKAKAKERILLRWDITNCLFQDEKSFVPHALHCLSEMRHSTILAYKIICRILWADKQMYPCQIQQLRAVFWGPEISLILQLLNFDQTDFTESSKDRTYHSIDQYLNTRPRIFSGTSGWNCRFGNKSADNIVLLW